MLRINLLAGPTETWIAAPSYEGVEVSSSGRIREHGVVMPTHNAKGYPKVYLKCMNQGRYVHQVVADAYHGPSLGRQVNHKNGKRADNRPENLEWVTSSENITHSYRVLGQKAPRGEDSPRAKLTNEQVWEIVRKYDPKKRNQSALAREYGVTQTTIWGIVRKGRRVVYERAGTRQV